MKLASYKDGSRDGQLIVVSRDLKWAHYATGAATRMQHLLDDWGFISPQLQDIYDALDRGSLRHAFAFEPEQCAAPLPRAHVWARIDEVSGEPLFGPGDPMGSSCESIALPAGIRAFEARIGFAAITGDVPAHAAGGQAIDGVRLLTLLVDIHGVRADVDSPGTRQVRALFGPIAVTPDELGAAWQGGRVGLAPRVTHNGSMATEVQTSADTRQAFGDVIGALARVQRIGAGAVVGATGIDGAGAIALNEGDRLRVDVIDQSGALLAGSIEMSVALADAAIA